MRMLGVIAQDLIYLLADQLAVLQICFIATFVRLLDRCVVARQVVAVVLKEALVPHAVAMATTCRLIGR